MSVEEPTALGTIATLPREHIAVRARAGNHHLTWAVLDPGGEWVGWASWEELDNPVIVHEGYTPPTPEGSPEPPTYDDGHRWEYAMPEGHCGHCADWCSGGELASDGVYEDHHSVQAWASWMAGHCPACAEARDIVRDLRVLLALEHGPHVLGSGIRKAIALVIARGIA